MSLFFYTYWVNVLVSESNKKLYRIDNRYLYGIFMQAFKPIGRSRSSVRKHCRCYILITCIALNQHYAVPDILWATIITCIVLNQHYAVPNILWTTIITCIVLNQHFAVPNIPWATIITCIVLNQHYAVPNIHWATIITCIVLNQHYAVSNIPEFSTIMQRPSTQLECPAKIY